MKNIFWWVLTVLGCIFGPLIALLSIPGLFKGFGGAILDHTNLAYHLGEALGSLVLLVIGLGITKNAILIPGKLKRRQLQSQQIESPRL